MPWALGLGFVALVGRPTEDFAWSHAAEFRDSALSARYAHNQSHTGASCLTKERRLGCCSWCAAVAGEARRGMAPASAFHTGFG